jgi:hypothetical protein
MNRNILLLRRKKKDQIEDLKKFKEISAQKAEFKRLNDPDPNKYNPDIPSKYQDDKNLRNKIIKPSNFKIDNDKITEKKDDLNNLLQSKILERNKKLEIPTNVVKKRIISSDPITTYGTQKKTVEEIKKENDIKIEKGKEVKNAILDFYK